MKLNKKNGFSLIEILAVIVIIGIVSAIAVTSYNYVKTSVLESEYENLVYQIEMKAEDYAFDNNIDASVYYVTAETLYETGYLTADEEGLIISPLDGSTLNCNVITIKYVDGVYKASFDDTFVDYDPGCSENNEVGDGNIIIDANDPYNNSGELWYSGDEIILSYDNKSSLEVKSYDWSTNLGASGENSSLSLNITGTLNTTYYLSVIFEDGTSDSGKVSINIDNESPTITSVSSSSAWSNSNKSITISATDHTGSGIAAYYYSYCEYDSEDCTDYKEYDIKTDTFSNGTGYIYAIDYCGNKSEPYEFSINNIDSVFPDLTSVNIVDASSTTLTIEASDDDSGIKGYKLTTDDVAPTSGYSTTIEIPNEEGSYYLWVSDKAGNVVSENISIGSYTYVYNNGDSDSEKIYFLEGVSEFDLEAPEKDNYTFDCWNNSGTIITKISQLTGSNVLEAEYNYNDLEFTVVKFNEEKMNIVSKIHLIFVIDKSSSMSSTEMSTVKTAVAHIMEETEFSTDSIFSVVSFNSSATTNLAYSDDSLEVISVVNSIGSSGGTDFDDALDTANNLATNSYTYSKGFDSTNTYVIFLSDGIDTASSTTLDTIKKNVNSIYTIGIGYTSSSSTELKTIATTRDEITYYYSYSNTTDVVTLITILESITENIAENETVTTINGKYELSGLIVSSETPFILKIGTKNYEFTSISDLSKLLSIINGTYYLNFSLIDEIYKLNRDTDDVKITYYYN